MEPITASPYPDTHLARPPEADVPLPLPLLTARSRVVNSLKGLDFTPMSLLTSEMSKGNNPLLPPKWEETTVSP